MKIIQLQGDQQVVIPASATSIRIYVDTKAGYTEKGRKTLAQKAQAKVRVRNSNLAVGAGISVNTIVRFNQDKEGMYVQIKDLDDFCNIKKMW